MISMTDMKVQEDPLLPTNGVTLEIIEQGNESSALENGKNGMLYGVEDSPPWPTKLFMGFQQLMVAVGGAIVLPIMVADLICAE
uniref:Solute carrier family 11 member 1 n=1 Tax=Plectus sambesii TaxID=2011161 RepID=A0A914VE16_9BILA